ncbi:hypothetical protein R3P38DRAFT_3207689 [Favolaschia claudopus]|uniref:Uncharacterized protein n=1 Tax=Favolaschia claudopus TaxID=2862362 RepID=A0AAW0AIQ8_9AGAR
MSEQMAQEDRALKEEALRWSRDDTRPVSFKTVSWLSIHSAPSKPGLNAHQRKFTELRARVAARKAALEQHLENLEREAREQREREARKKAEREKERAAHAARMKDLDDKWAAGEERRKRFIYI